MGRAQLQVVLETLLGVPENVYFQPPDNLQMAFPCIVYKRDNASTDFADNHAYRYHQRYQVTHISQEAMSPDVFGKLVALPMCLYNRYFSANKLHHDVFVLYFGGVEA